MRLKAILTSLALAVTQGSAQFFAQYCPAPDICYRLHIPSSTASTGKGDIFIQINALVSYTWLGIGLGHQMAGAKIFIVYADGKGNVTLSPRLGLGHYDPEYDPDADAELLVGSGVYGYKLTANIRCGDCNAWVGGGMDFTASSGTWIYAARPGLPLNSNNPDEKLQIHWQNGVFDFDYAAAKGTPPTDANPNQPIPTLNITLQGLRPPPNPVVWKPTDAFPIAHGTVASLAMLVGFPLGAILIRVTAERRLVWVHAGIQIASYFFLFAAMGMGIHMASSGDLFHNKHPMIGIALVVILFFQAVDGLLHHAQWVLNKRRRTALAYVHIWTGRFCIVVGMINGGFGLQLAKVESVGKKVGYGIVAGVSFVCLVVAICYGERKRHLAFEAQRLEGERKRSADGVHESSFE